MNAANLQIKALTIVLLAMLPGFGQLLAQNADISGTWVLKERQIISGLDYANGIPRQMVIAVSSDSLSLSRTYDGGTNKDNIVSESLALNGLPTEVLRTVSRRKSLLKKGSDANEFSIEVTFRDIKTGARTNSDFIENWKLSASGKELTIEKNANGADGSSWSMKGVYELKTKGQVEQEQATGNGIQFIENRSWEEIKALAKRVNKYIFVDCFATWCLPCKQMEKEIFRLNFVGTQMNENFIAVRLQMDTTKKDEAPVKQWYAIAHQFFNDYNLVGYPTYLFFDPNGNIVHKALGKYEANEFLSLLETARDPSKQYYTLLDDYRKGKRDYESIPYLAINAQKLGDNKLANEIMADYKKNFLAKLPPDSLLTKKYLSIALPFQALMFGDDGSHGVFFNLFYQKGKVVDQFLNAPGYSDFNVNAIVAKEEIQDKIYINKKPIPNPQWEKYRSAIRKKYSKLSADSLVLSAKIEYYGAKKDWSNQINYFVKKIDRYGPLSVGMPGGQGSDNAIADLLLSHCEDMQILNKAIGWMEQIIHSKAYMYPVPMVYGNYGAILYKAGRTEDGIAALEKQLNAVGYKTPADLDKLPDAYKPKIKVLERLKRGEKIDSTWDTTLFF